jgi:hypothetical protein
VVRHRDRAARQGCAALPGMSVVAIVVTAAVYFLLLLLLLLPTDD